MRILAITDVADANGAAADRRHTITASPRRGRVAVFSKGAVSLLVAWGDADIDAQTAELTAYVPAGGAREITTDDATHVSVYAASSVGARIEEIG